MAFPSCAWAWIWRTRLKVARQVASSFSINHTGPEFGIFRTILWTPSAHKQLIDTLHKDRPDIVFVDPYTLFELLRRDLNAHR